jgi:hypothetical protein
MALLLQLPTEIYDTLLPYLDGRAAADLRRCCTELRDLLDSLEPTFRALTVRWRPLAACRMLPRHQGLWRRYYYEQVRVDEQRDGLQILSLEGSTATLVRLSSALQPIEVIRVGSAPAICASPNGRLLAYDADECIVVMDVRTKAKREFDSRGG